MADMFRIGKAGPTILVGEAEPDDSVGRPGDLFILYGTDPSLWIKRDDTWVPSADPRFSYARQAVTAAAASIGPKASYVGVSASSASTVTLPPASAGRQLIIKDESGAASSRPITVQGPAGATIDGQSSWLINMDYGSLHLIYGDTQWHIIAGVASSPYNQMRI